MFAFPSQTAFQYVGHQRKQTEAKRSKQDYSNGLEIMLSTIAGILKLCRTTFQFSIYPAYGIFLQSHAFGILFVVPKGSYLYYHLENPHSVADCFLKIAFCSGL